MRRHLGWIPVVGLLLMLAPASRAHAQMTLSFGYPGYGMGYSGYGYGVPGYGYSGLYGGTYGYGGYGLGGFYPGASYYGSGYSSFYAAPGTRSFVSGSFAPYGPGAAVLGGYRAGYPGAYGYGYGYSPLIGGNNTRWVSKGMFMGLPRPGGGLIQVPN